MAYETALKTAGAVVHNFEEFGSYQGEWWAKVTYNGQQGWVNGSYGSCSGCDAFQAEFGYDSHACGNKEYYDPMYDDDGFRDSCETCQSLKKRLADFGKVYLEDLMTQEQAEASAAKNLDWDHDAQEMLNFIKANPAT